MYLVLRPPWGGGAAPPPTDEPVAMVPGDAGAGSAKPTKKRPPKKRPTGSTTVATGGPDEFEETEPELPPLTDADRRLEWRGDDVTLPAQRIDMGASGESRALEDSEINATINAQSG